MYLKHKENKEIPPNESIPKDEYEAIDVYVRTKVIFETNIEKAFKDWKTKVEA